MKPRAIIVSVDYHDLLQLTIPYNRDHFEEVWIVTCPDDLKSQKVALGFGCELVVTDLFYKEGADFNKWGALEWGLDQMGRNGWICVMDADVVWPKRIPLKPIQGLKVGQLMTPYRRMCPLVDSIPEESRWMDYPRHRNTGEWAGYSQLFHADDPVLRERPWYREWKHAGGADSFFQRRWSRKNKIRPDWECLHIGPAGKNWTGRITPYIDGSEPDQREERERRFKRLREQRRRRRGDYSGEILE